MGGLGLGTPPSSPSAVSFLGHQAASAPTGIPHLRAASSKAALLSLGIGEEAASD